jgi:hypothetical protein
MYEITLTPKEFDWLHAVVSQLNAGQVVRPDDRAIAHETLDALDRAAQVEAPST